jgi:LL-diaminopimelate aminotransferase
MAAISPYVFDQMDQIKRELTAKGVDLINLGVGDPDCPTPDYVVEALRRSAGDPSTHQYPPYEGTKEFRLAIADRYQHRFGVELDAEREVLACIGSKEGLAHLIWAYVEPGDVVILPDPAYPVYQTHTRLCGGTAHLLPLIPENDFRPAIRDVPPETARRAKLVFVNYPNNPTSAVASLDYFREIVEFAREYDLLVCHDGAYVETTYDGFTAPSILQVPGARDVCIEFYSLSKPFNMTGWRIAAAVGNEAALSVLRRLKTNTDSGQFTAVQHAASVALTSNPDAFIQRMNAVYRERRDIVVSALRESGHAVPSTKGGIYVWFRVPPEFSDERFASLLLEEAGVMLTPGSAYGTYGRGHVRISLTVPTDRLEEAMQRMHRVLK